MNEIEEVKIEGLIYEIRGKQVMLDSDLARLYDCKNGTKDINKAVSRNKEKFPSDFYFQLTFDEVKLLRFQNGTLELKQGQYSKYLPHVFTEQGVAMLSTVIHTSVASKVSVDIMRAFVLMRKYISNNLIEQRYINEMVLTHDKDIKLLQKSFDELSKKEVKNEIYFNGQIYDAYSKILDIMYEAKKELIIVDGYADKSVLDMISKLKVKVILIVKSKGLISKLDISKYNNQYNNLKVIYDNTFHDRYLILDRNKVYHLGASINHIGSKTFSINILEEEMVIDLLVKKIESIL